MNFYNDIDKNAAAWTQQLITNKLIPDGVMVCKSITDIQPHELNGFTQAHWFNGISGWARALDLAGWPATRPIWCASLPCQPFSCAGKGEGANDERHLWPVFFQLVKACKPVVIVGEQVEASIGHGWLDGVFTDLEGEGYTCGAVIVGAHSVKSPHRRQRIYWVAYTTIGGHGQERNCSAGWRESVSCGQHDTNQSGGIVGNSHSEGLEGHRRHVNIDDTVGWEAAKRHSSPAGFWDGSVWHLCRDGKHRRIPLDAKPVLQCLVDGLPEGVDDIGLASLGFPLSKTIPNRVALLKGYGNAIVPQVAAEFIKVVMEII